MASRTAVTEADLLRLETEVQLTKELPQLTDPLAIELDRIGLVAEARRVEDCGKFADVYECPDGHNWRLTQTCKCHFEKNCADILDSALRNDYEFLWEHYCNVARKSPLYSVRVELKVKVTFGSLRDFSVGVRKLIVHSADGRVSGIIRVVPIIRDGQEYLAAKFICCGVSQPRDVFLAHWPELETVQVAPIRSKESFVKELHALSLSELDSDPVVLARFAQAFKEFRAVVTFGNFYGFKHKRTLADALPGTELTSLGGSKGSKFGPRCSQCHQPAVKVCRHVPFDRSLIDIASLKMERIIRE